MSKYQCTKCKKVYKTRRECLNHIEIHKIKHNKIHNYKNNANISGEAFENKTNLESLYHISKQKNNYRKVCFSKNIKIKFIECHKINFCKYLNIDAKKLLHGSKRPDNCFVNENTKIIFIIEKNIRIVMVLHVKNYKQHLLNFIAMKK